MVDSARRDRLRRLLARLGPFLGLIFVVALFGALRPEQFFGAVNLRTVPVQAVTVAVAAIGMTFVIASGGIDLSVGSSMALTTVVVATALKSGIAPSLAMLLGILSGALTGLLNGLLTVRLKITPFIVTLGTMKIIRGAAKAIASDQKVDASAEWLPLLVRKDPVPSWILLAPAVWIALLAAIFMGIVLKRGVLGIRAVAVGSNESAARLCGVPVERTKVLVYVVEGLFVGLAGVLYFARLTVGDPTAAPGEELPVIAAVVIGGASLAGGQASVLGSVVGALVMAVLANGCNLVDMPNYVQDIVVGAVIVVAVALDRLRK
jgi:ribose transport system permease protein